MPEMAYWLLTTRKDGEPGINGGILKRWGAPAADAPITGFVSTAQVPSADQAARTIERAGGSIVVPKMAIPM